MKKTLVASHVSRSKIRNSKQNKKVKSVRRYAFCTVRGRPEFVVESLAGKQHRIKITEEVVL